MWPGRARSVGTVSAWIAVCTVALRSAAEMPVDTPRLASIDTQKAVLKRDEFSDTINGISSSSSR